MIRTAELKAIIKESGYSLKKIADLLGIKEKTLSKKIENGDLRLGEMYDLVDILHISDPAYIFFPEFT